MVNAKYIQKWCESKIKRLEKEVVEELSKEIEKSAKRNFQQNMEMVGADDPFVSVSRSTNGKEATITCKGNQVLFIEFGAGANNTWNEMSDRPTTSSFKMIGGNLTEVAPRPRQNGIVGLGEYGKGLGKNDYWVRPTRTMLPKGRETFVHNKDGSIKYGVLWTMGTRPMRALWRARNSALDKIIYQKKIRRLGQL